MDSTHRLLLLTSAGIAGIVSLHALKREPVSIIQKRIDGSDDFRAAAEYFGKNAGKFSPDMQLKLYGLFKQVTCGDAATDVNQGLGLLDAKRRLMNDAWTSQRGIERRDAELEYIRIIDQTCPGWRTAGESRDDDPCEPSEPSGWAVGSIPRDLIGNHDTDDSMIGQLCELVVDGNLQAVSDVISKDPSFVNKQDKDGMTCLHWASDRGHNEMVELLLGRKSDPNIQDSLGNTPLHMAAEAHQQDIVRLLLILGADVSIKNHDGETAESIIKSEFPDITLD